MPPHLRKRAKMNVRSVENIDDPPADYNYKNELHSLIGRQCYLSENLADFHFTFETSHRIPAHKLLLSASDVFQKMFNGSWKEVNEVKVVDASVEAFKEFLQFFYLNDVKMSMENAAEVMNLGTKYNVKQCVNACDELLLHGITYENACRSLELAYIFDRDEVKEECENIIEINTMNVLMSSSFLHCDKKVLSFILMNDSLQCSEAELFKAVMAWVKTKSKENELTKKIIETELGNLFYEFRFRSMTLKEFSDLIPSYGSLFNINEHQDIIQMIASNKYEAKIFSNIGRSGYRTASCYNNYYSY